MGVTGEETLSEEMHGDREGHGRSSGPGRAGPGRRQGRAGVSQVEQGREGEEGRGRSRGGGLGRVNLGAAQSKGHRCGVLFVRV